MKKYFIFILMLAAWLSNCAQDVIVKKDGRTILSKILEVNPNDVKYKKFSNPTGPTYTIIKSEIMTINYENGEIDDMSNESSINTSSPLKPSVSLPDANNKNLLAIYNTNHSLSHIKSSSEAAKYYIAIMGVTEESVLSTKDIEISFQPTFHYSYHFWKDMWFANMSVYEIIVKNKSNNTIYIDLGNTFRINSNDNYYIYYDPKQVTVTEGRHLGGSLNAGSIASAFGIGGVVGTLAGGLNVGGGTSNSVSTTYVNQRILSIPPHAKTVLCEDKVADAKKNSTIISQAEPFFHGGGIKYGELSIGQVKQFTGANTPYKNRYIITYSKDANFELYSTIDFSTYLREIIGTSKANGNFNCITGLSLVAPDNGHERKECIEFGQKYILGYDIENTIFNVFKTIK